MGNLVAGDVVVSFPFSDLSGQKLRPALVLSQAEFDNIILCQITSKPYTSKRAVKITGSDFSTGSLPIESYVRPDKLFTAESTIVQRVAGKLSREPLHSILQKVRDQFQPSLGEQDVSPPGNT